MAKSESSDLPSPNLLVTFQPPKIIPVIVINELNQAQPLGEALVAHGLPIAEVTLRTPCALDAIAEMSRIPGLLVGAGTITHPDQIQHAADAGAQFFVSPGLRHDLVTAAQDLSVRLVPGIATPSELMQAQAFGLDLVKFFPAMAAGGLAMVQAFASVFPSMRLMPTGGITANNVLDFLKLPNVLACGGSWMVPQDALRRGDFKYIGHLIQEAVALLQSQP